MGIVSVVSAVLLTRANMLIDGKLQNIGLVQSRPIPEPPFSLNRQSGICIDHMHGVGR